MRRSAKEAGLFPWLAVTPRTRRVSLTVLNEASSIERCLTRSSADVCA